MWDPCSPTQCEPEQVAAHQASKYCVRKSVDILLDFNLYTKLFVSYQHLILFSSILLLSTIRNLSFKKKTKTFCCGAIAIPERILWTYGKNSLSFGISEFGKMCCHKLPFLVAYALLDVFMLPTMQSDVFYKSFLDVQFWSTEGVLWPQATSFFQHLLNVWCWRP